MRSRSIRCLKLGFVAALSMALGCSHLEQVPIEDELGHPGQPERPWVLIDGITVRDGSTIRLRGYAGTVGDSFFVYREAPDPGGSTRPLIALPRSEVRSLDFRVADKEKTVLLVVTFTVLAAALAAIIISSSVTFDSTH